MKIRKYTAIYRGFINSFHKECAPNDPYTLLCRIKVRSKETVLDALKRHGIDKTIMYLLVGWPKRKGETGKLCEKVNIN